MSVLYKNIGPQSNYYVFYGNASSNTAASWQTFTIPENSKYIQIFCLGAGGGGGGGVMQPGTQSVSGGGGGGSGAVVSAIYPTYFLRETIYVSVGLGGNGAAGSAVSITLGTPPYNGLTGANGTPSIVSLFPDASSNTYFLAYADGGYGGPGGGTDFRPASSIAVVGGSGGSATNSYTAPFAAIGAYSVSPGANGAGYYTTTLPVTTPSTYSLSALSNGIVSGGGAGGGGGLTAIGYDGGSVYGNNQLITVPGGLGFNGSVANTSAKGNDGTWNWEYMIGTGGSGGGGSGNSINAFYLANGGIGSIGCGGGGGGSSSGTGYASLQNGYGGKGGDGLVIISCW